MTRESIAEAGVKMFINVIFATAFLGDISTVLGSYSYTPRIVVSYNLWWACIQIKALTT